MISTLPSPERVKQMETRFLKARCFRGVGRVVERQHESDCFPKNKFLLLPRSLRESEEFLRANMDKPVLTRLHFPGGHVLAYHGVVGRWPLSDWPYIQLHDEVLKTVSQVSAEHFGELFWCEIAVAPESEVTK